MAVPKNEWWRTFLPNQPPVEPPQPAPTVTPLPPAPALTAPKPRPALSLKDFKRLYFKKKGQDFDMNRGAMTDIQVGDYAITDYEAGEEYKRNYGTGAFVRSGLGTVLSGEVPGIPGIRIAKILKPEKTELTPSDWVVSIGQLALMGVPASRLAGSAAPAVGAAAQAVGALAYSADTAMNWNKMDNAQRVFSVAFDAFLLASAAGSIATAPADMRAIKDAQLKSINAVQKAFEPRVGDALRKAQAGIETEDPNLIRSAANDIDELANEMAKVPKSQRPTTDAFLKNIHQRADYMRNNAEGLAVSKQTYASSANQQAFSEALGNTGKFLDANQNLLPKFTPGGSAVPGQTVPLAQMVGGATGTTRSPEVDAKVNLVQNAKASAGTGQVNLQSEDLEKMLDLHNQNGGATYNLSQGQGDMVGKKAYAVAAFPERGTTVEGKRVSPEDLSKFIRANSDILSQPDVHVGTWYNEKDGKTYLDISLTSSDLDTAQELGRRYNQQAIFDLQNMEEIPVSARQQTAADVQGAAVMQTTPKPAARKPKVSVPTGSPVQPPTAAGGAGTPPPTLPPTATGAAQTPPVPPKIPKTPEQIKDIFTKLSRQYKKAVKITAAERSVESAKRIRSYGHFLQKNIEAGVGAEESLSRPFSTLAGEMPSKTLPTPAITDEERDTLFQIVVDKRNKGDLIGYDVPQATAALKKFISGNVFLNPSDIEILDKTFGESFTRQLPDMRSLAQKVLDGAYDLINAPKSIKFAGDLSFVLNQGQFELANSPELFGKTIRAGAYSALGMANYEKIYDEVRKTKWYPLLADKRFGFNAPLPPGQTIGAEDRGTGFFTSKLIQKIPLIKQFVNASSRAFDAPALVTYAKGVNDFAEALAGNTPVEEMMSNPTFVRDVKDFAGMLNASMGRPNLGQFGNKVAKWGNVPFTSTKYILSRWITPAYVLSPSPAVRKQAASRLVKYFSAMLASQAAFGIAKLLAGDESKVDVEWDIRSSRFGKMRVGNVWVNPPFGAYYNKWARFVVQMAIGKRVTSDGSLVKTDRDQLAKWFVQSYFSPVAQLFNTLSSGETFTGVKVAPTGKFIGEIAKEMFMPMTAEDIYDATRDEAALGWGLGAYSILGGGTYREEPKEASPAQGRPQEGTPSDTSYLPGFK